MGVMPLVCGKMDSPKSPMWESEGELWSEDEYVCRLVALEKAMCATKRCTISGCMSLVTGLGANKSSIELSHGPGRALPGNA